jgi:NTP pyrophosphatase (non-canonical NTP hydrolase)
MGMETHVGLQAFANWIETRWSKNPRYEDLAIATLGLSGEVDEVAGELIDLRIVTGRVTEHVKKEIRGSKPVNVGKLKLELGDVLHYWCVLANRYKIDVNDIVAANIDKLEARERDMQAKAAADRAPRTE